MAYYEYRIPVNDQQKRDIAIALLTDLGLYGFEETDAELIGFSKRPIDADELNQIFQVLDLSFSESVIEDKNWNEIWESEFQPITVLDVAQQNVFAYVRAHFHPAPADAQYDLVITPKMSFGTGHHATTYGMMSYMSTIDFHGLKVIDFGTGTGLLAILAEKMGAVHVLATDNDPWCIRNAGENITVNECTHIELLQSDHFESTQSPDVILANINLNIIKDNLGLIAKACNENTLLLFSGVMLEDETEILAALSMHDIKEINIIKNNGWLIIAAKSSRQIVTLTEGR